MVTVSRIAQKLVNDRVFIQEAMSKGIVSYGALAEQLKPEIEEELGRQAKHSAIVMALRRYADILKKRYRPVKFDYTSEIILKTDVCDIAVLRSPTLLDKLKEIYDTVNFEVGDMLNVIHGRYEVSIMTNKRYLKTALKVLKREKVLNTETDLVSLTLTFSKDFLYTPGVIFSAVRQMAWENINIYEIVSTNTELTFILHKDDAMRAYESLDRMFGA